jgi:hypothetical protein
VSLLVFAVQSTCTLFLTIYAIRFLRHLIHLLRNAQVPADAILAGSIQNSFFYNISSLATVIFIFTSILLASGALINAVVVSAGGKGTVATVAGIPKKSKSRRTRRLSVVQLLSIAGVVSLVGLASEAIWFFYATDTHIALRPVGAVAMHNRDWQSVVSIRLDCSSINHSRFGPPTHVPDYDLVFSDGSTVDLWFGSAVDRDVFDDPRLDFRRQYGRIRPLLPPHASIEVADVRGCYRAFRSLQDPAIDARLQQPL